MGANILNVDLSYKQSLAWEYLENDPAIEELFYGGSAGGGKSRLGCDWQIYRRLMYPGTRGLRGRKQFTDLMTRTWKTFQERWGEVWKFNEMGGTCRKGGENEIFGSNGRETILKAHS